MGCAQSCGSCARNRDIRVESKVRKSQKVNDASMISNRDERRQSVQSSSPMMASLMQGRREIRSERIETSSQVDVQCTLIGQQTSEIFDTKIDAGKTLNSSSAGARREKLKPRSWNSKRKRKKSFDKVDDRSTSKMLASGLSPDAKHTTQEPADTFDSSRSSNKRSEKDTLMDGGKGSEIRANERENEVVLFTSIQQLCSEIVQTRLLAKAARIGEERERQVLCLFVFGRPGSCKGEIAFELVQHSALLAALGQREASEMSDCPLYHYIDVATVIVANIDARIREYNSLVAQTLRVRKEQLALNAKAIGGTDGQSEDLDSRGEQEAEVNESLETTGETLADERASVGSNSAGFDATKQQQQQEESLVADEFGLITLSTKQRSILQLKLMKYFNSITSKWVLGLIQAEIDNLELRVKQNSHLAPRKRVYLINLVPNQLSLFKSCLYLQQDLPIKEFKYPFEAIKFERRTNIKLMTSERRIIGDQQTHCPKSSSKLTNLRLPILGINFNKTSNGQQAKGSAGKQNGFEKLSADLVESGDGTNERLVPKYNDNFARQFKCMNKLIEMRYNPIQNYNYANDQSHEKVLCKQWAPRAGSGQVCSPLLVVEEEEEKCRVAYGDGAASFKLRPGARSMSSSMQNLEASCRPADAYPRLSLSGGQFMDKHRAQVAPLQVASSSSSVVSFATSDAEPAEAGRLEWLGPKDRTGCPIKLAIGIELLDSSVAAQRQEAGDRLLASQRRPPSSAAHLDGSALSAGSLFRSRSSCTNSAPTVVYLEPKEARSGSRSPLAFARHRKARGMDSRYQLVPVRIAYANEQSRVAYEVRKVYSRVLKLKCDSDLERLIKLIGRLRGQLACDCESWLYEAIGERAKERLGPPNGLHRRDPTETGQHHSPGHSRAGELAGLDLRKPASLIVCVVRVDVGRTCLDSFQCAPKLRFVGPADLLEEQKKGEQRGGNKSLVPILTLNDGSARRPAPVCDETRPMSAQSPLKSGAQCKTRRHVQFRLSQSPNEPASGGDNSGPLAQLKAQHRRWIGESLFVCWEEERAGSSAELVVALLEFGLGLGGE